MPEVVNVPPAPLNAPTPVSQHLVNAGLFRNAADEKTAAGDFASAITLYEQAIKLNPDDSELLLCRAMAYRLSSPPQYQAALLDANAAIQSNPTSWYAWHTKGELLGCLDDYDGAEEAFREAHAFASGMDKIKVFSSVGDIRKKRELANTRPPQVLTSPHHTNTPPTTHQQPAFNTQSNMHTELPSPSPSYSTPTSPPSAPSLTVPTQSTNPYSSPSTPAIPSRTPSPYISTPTTLHTTPSPGQQHATSTPAYQAPTPSSNFTDPSQPLVPIPLTPLSATQSTPTPAPTPQRAPSIAVNSTPAPTTSRTSSFGNTLQPSAISSSPGSSQATAPSQVRPPPSPSIGTRTMGTATTSSTTRMSLRCEI